MLFAPNRFRPALRNILLAAVLVPAGAISVCAAPEISVEGPGGTPMLTGKLVVWGNNNYGQAVIPAAAQSEVVWLAPGDRQSVVVKGDGSIIAWGGSTLGELNNAPAAGPREFKMVESGDAHTLILNNDGTVTAFGNNQNGQATVPATATDIIAVDGGAAHSIALKSNGKVIVWGYTSNAPQTLTGVTAIAAGGNHNLALKSNGTVTAWGVGGPQTQVPPTLTNVKAVAAGLEHSIALRNDGTLVAWGNNTYGQTTIPAGLSGVVDVSAGKYHNLALKSDGTVAVWGRNFSGTTVVPAGLKFVKAIKAGDSHNMALVDSVADFGDGTILSPGAPQTFTIRNTGESDLNITGIGTTGGSAADFTLSLPALPLSIPAGGQASFTVGFSPVSIGSKTTSLRILNDDADEKSFTVTLTGRAFPEIDVFTGGGTAPADERVDNTGEHVFPDTVNSNISAPQTFTLRNSGINPLSGISVTLSGLNPKDFSVSGPASPTLAPGATASFSVSFAPRLKGLRTATVMIANDDENENPFRIKVAGTGMGPEVSLELADGTPLLTGSVVAWGPNSSGETDVPAGLSGVASLSASSQSLALKNDGTLVSWGSNSSGQINTPAGLDGLKAVSAGALYTLALKQDGTVTSWGYNSDGRRTVPAGLSGVVALSTGAGQSAALKSDGTLVVWGKNAFLPDSLKNGGVRSVVSGDVERMALKEDGTVVIWGDYSYIPTAASGFSPAVAVAAGAYHVAALKADGTVLAATYWSFDQPAAHVPDGLTNVTAISAGHEHCLALKKDGTVAAWGYEGYGQIHPPAGLTGVKAVCAGYFHSLALIDSTVDFGSQAAAQTGVAKTFIVKNNGTAPLDITAAALLGENPEDFILDRSGMPASIPVGGQASLNVSFSPRSSALGTRRAMLRISNNDLDEGSYDTVLSGSALAATGPDALETWRQAWFQSSANSGTAANTADPDNDGIVNLLEYALATDPTSPGSMPGLSLTALPEGGAGITYRRPPGAQAAVQYIVEISENNFDNWQPATAGQHVQTITPNGDGTETVTITLPAGTPLAQPVRRFARVRVSG